MQATIDPAHLMMAKTVFQSMTGNDLRKLVTRVLSGGSDGSAFDVYHTKALEIIAAGPEGIADLPQEQAEVLVKALVVFGQMCAAFRSAPAEHDLKITLKPGAVEAAHAILKTHAFLFIISPENQWKLIHLGDTERERTVIVTVRESGLSWGHLIRQLMGHIESIEHVAA